MRGVRSAHPEHELSVAYRTPKRAGHGYISINLDTVWDTIASDPPDLAAAVRVARDGLEPGQ